MNSLESESESNEQVGEIVKAPVKRDIDLPTKRVSETIRVSPFKKREIEIVTEHIIEPMVSSSSSASYDANNPDDSLSQSSHSSLVTQSDKGSEKNFQDLEEMYGFTRKAFRLVK